MADIPGWVLVIVGIVIAGASIYFNIVQKNMKMTLFIVAGILIAAWGIVKGKLGAK